MNTMNLWEIYNKSKELCMLNGQRAMGMIPQASQEELTAEAERILKRSQKNKVSGQTTEYVNRMIAKYNS